MPAATARKMKHPPAPHDAKINLRLPEKDKTLIDTAAALAGKSRSEFVVESARRNAIDVLLDQRLFELPPRQWDAFRRALDEAPPPAAKLRQLLAKKPLWEN